MAMVDHYLGFPFIHQLTWLDTHAITKQLTDGSWTGAYLCESVLMEDHNFVSCLHNSAKAFTSYMNCPPLTTQHQTEMPKSPLKTWSTS